jgi:hypothetical protein
MFAKNDHFYREGQITEEVAQVAHQNNLGFLNSIQTV